VAALVSSFLLVLDLVTRFSLCVLRFFLPPQKKIIIIIK